MKRLWLLGLLVLVAGLITASVASAQVTAPPAGALTAPVGGTVTGTGIQPIVNSMWMLPDMQDDVAGIQYGTPANAHAHDQDMTVDPIDIAPNLWDFPAPQLLEFWAAVESPVGVTNITDVFVQVYHPAGLAANIAGTEKYQIHMRRVTCDTLGATVSATTGAVIFPVGSVLEAAIDTGQMSAAEAAEIVRRCYKNEKAIYRVVGTISKDQPFGVYTWTVSAVGIGGATATYGTLPLGSNLPAPIAAFPGSTFTVLPIMGLVADFAPAGGPGGLDFGAIFPGTTDVLSGDELIATPAQPTVMSIGNLYLNLNIRFSNLVGAQFGKIINMFDIIVGRVDSPMQAVQPAIGYGDPNAPPGVLIVNPAPLVSNTNYTLLGYCLIPDVQTQVDFSLHPPAILPNDIYAGSVWVWGTPCDPALQWTNAGLIRLTPVFPAPPTGGVDVGLSAGAFWQAGNPAGGA